MDQKERVKNIGRAISCLDKVLNGSNKTRKVLTRPEAFTIAGPRTTLTNSVIRDIIKNS